MCQLKHGPGTCSPFELSHLGPSYGCSPWGAVRPQQTAKCMPKREFMPLPARSINAFGGPVPVFDKIDSALIAGS
jgi:hypothetical protein